MPAWIRSARARLALGGLALVAVVAFGLVPIVSAASPAPSTSPAGPTASPAAEAGQSGAGARNALLAGTVRGEATVVKRDGSTILIHFERGRVTAVSQTSITIQGRDGKGATFAVDARTQVRAKGETIPYSDLKVGDRATVFGLDQGGTYTAIQVRLARPASGS